MQAPKQRPLITGKNEKANQWQLILQVEAKSYVIVFMSGFCAAMCRALDISTARENEKTLFDWMN